MSYLFLFIYFFFFKQKTAYEMRISDWSSDVCSSDLLVDLGIGHAQPAAAMAQHRVDLVQLGRPMAQPLDADPGRARQPLQLLVGLRQELVQRGDRKSTRLNSSH